jgi:hypothetical protein
VPRGTMSTLIAAGSFYTALEPDHFEDVAELAIIPARRAADHRIGFAAFDSSARR